MDFINAYRYVIDRMKKELNPTLTYHNSDHTLDMHSSVIRLMDLENVTDAHTRMIMETAAIYHDCGMMISYSDHEDQSVFIAEKNLPSFGYSPVDICEVSKLILVTRLPQMPDNLPEKILCDADLDSLGREDFFIRSFQLQLEWELNGIRKTTLEEWLKFEEDFLENHHFFTDSARNLRDQTKSNNLLNIKSLLNRINTNQ